MGLFSRINIKYWINRPKICAGVQLRWLIEPYFGQVRRFQRLVVLFNVSEILHPRRFPEIRFESTDIDEEDDDELEVHGKLTLHGRTGYLTCKATRRDEHWVVEVPINQPDYGVKPFRAMMGTLKIKPVITIQFSVPTLD